MSGALPPGLAQEAFEQALDGFRAAVGPDWVFSDQEHRESYLDPFAIGEQDEHACSASVAPANVEELRRVLSVANEHAIPLWPVSMGKNFAYGTAAPRLRGSVVLDLKRMNRILTIDERLGTALVEPGVSFFDLKAELDRRQSGLWMSGPAHSWGSVIGNALEHGVGYTPYGIHAGTICGMEVMLADGSLIRTGLGAVDGSQEWQCYQWPFGPGWDGAFTQSNFGIVTKMGVWLMPEPAGMAGVNIDVPDKGDLGNLIEVLRPLRLNDTINATYTIANGWRQITRGRRRVDVYEGAGAIPAARVGEILQQDRRGWWNVIFNLFDSPKGLDLRLDAVRRALAAGLPNARMEVRRWAKGEPKPAWLRQDVSLSPLGIVDWHGSPGGHSDFGPVVAPLAERVEQVYSLIERRFIEYGIDPWVGMFGMGNRAIVMVADLIYLRSDPEMMDRCRKLFRQLCTDMAGIGVGLYRSHITFMQDAADMHTWGAHALPAFNERIKRALDPNGIIAPGKQGIGNRT